MPALREDRARDRADRQQQQEEQRRAHARQLPPGPAQPAERPRAGAGRRRVVRSEHRPEAVDEPGLQPAGSSPPTAPVTSSRPTARSSAPPSSWMPRWWRRSAARDPAGALEAGGDEDEGQAQTEAVCRGEDDAAVTACWSPVVVASSMTAPRVGPVHGAQPSRRRRRAGGRRPGRPPACQCEPDLALAAGPEEDQRHEDDEDPAEPHEQGRGARPGPRRRRPRNAPSDEDDGEAGDEEQRAEHHPARGAAAARATSARPVT